MRSRTLMVALLSSGEVQMPGSLSRDWPWDGVGPALRRPAASDLSARAFSSRVRESAPPRRSSAGECDEQGVHDEVPSEASGAGGTGLVSRLRRVWSTPSGTAWAG